MTGHIYFYEDQSKPIIGLKPDLKKPIIGLPKNDINIPNWWPEIAPDICSGRISGFWELFSSANTCAYLSGLTSIILRLKRWN